LCRRVDLALELAGAGFSLRAAAAISGVRRQRGMTGAPQRGLAAKEVPARSAPARAAAC
jgi:hypothetical protein